MDDVTKNELDTLVELAKKYATSSQEIYSYIQKKNINISYANFYSAIPTVDDISNSFDLKATNGFYLHKNIFNKKKMKNTILSFFEYCNEFSPPTSGDKSNPSSFFWNNGMFSWADAMAYYCIIRKKKPRQIIEVGCGFSTLIALEAIKKNRVGKLTCIDPYPPEWLEASKGIELIKEKVQNIPASFFNEKFKNGDMLFIDSSHTVKYGSDCLYLYLHLIPSLNSELIIHAHDIFLPFPFPKDWALNHHLYWTEQYLLMAYILENPSIEVFFASHYNAHNFKESMVKLLDGKSHFDGSSFWFTHKAPL